MRPLLLLLGVWHGLVSIAAVLFGAYGAVELLLGPADPAVGRSPGWAALVCCLGGLTSIVALTLAAQGTTGRGIARLLLVAPLVAMFVYSRPWMGAAWSLCLMLVPGAVLGLLLGNDQSRL